MNFAPRCVPRLCGFLIIAFLALPRLAAEPLPLKRATLGFCGIAPGFDRIVAMVRDSSSRWMM